MSQAQRTLPETEPRIVVVRDAEALAREAATLLIGAIASGIETRGRADVALTGGSSAAALYRTLAGPDFQDRVDWGRVHLWWGDERYVPSGHPDSNAGLAFGTLLAIAARSTQSGEGAASTDVLAERTPGLPIPAENVHPIPVDRAIGRGPDNAAWAAEQYATELTQLPSDEAGVPIFDAVLLGVGSDGHILSAFPGSKALEPGGPIALAVPAPTHIGPHLERITLEPRILEAARTVLVMVPGEAKAEIVPLVLGDERDPDRWPAQLARRSNAIWLLDEAAARGLPGHPSTDEAPG